MSAQHQIVRNFEVASAVFLAESLRIILKDEDLSDADKVDTLNSLDSAVNSAQTAIEDTMEFYPSGASEND